MTQTDSAGDYELEIFDAPDPRAVIVCAHGNGVRRWDGERFYYAVAEHYPQDVCLLVDQCQVIDGGCQLNSLEVMVGRVQGLVERARTDYPDVPIIIMGHSMGCGISSLLDLTGVSSVIFVAPGAGSAYQPLIDRYGADVIDGKLVTTSDNLVKMISKPYVDSAKGVIWGDKYREMLQRFPNVYVYESGNEEIVGDDRLLLRDMPFAGYQIIPGATHNYAGEPLQRLFTELDGLLARPLSIITQMDIDRYTAIQAERP
jgi:pimeloyl-ACP methyl ester carboxylesterase